MTETCNAPSLKPLGGGVHYRDNTMEMHSQTDGHYCTLDAGHDGPHTKETRTRLGATVAMRTRYVWDDENELTAMCDVVEIEPPPTDQMRIVLKVSSSTSASGNY